MAQLEIYRRLVKLPFPKRWKLEWRQLILERDYARAIEHARKKRNAERVQELQAEYGFEMAMHEEEEDQYFTAKLLKKARKLGVPVPHKKDDFGNTSGSWYRGQYTGGWYLTTEGAFDLRCQIRGELKERRESRAAWAVWLSTATGVLGAITGLVAVLGKNG